MKVIQQTALIIFLGFFIACGDEELPGTVGEPITITAESLESGSDLDITWSILEQPSASWLSPEDATLSDNGLVATFIPDEPGKYVFQVTISQYGDELSTQSFAYSIEPSDGTESEVTREAITEEEWLGTPAETPASSMAADTEMTEPETPEPEPVIAAPPPPPVKAKPVPRIVPGSTIPYDKNRFTIQVAARRALEDAEKVAADLIDAGFDAYIQKATFKENGQTWYRVRVGSYDDRNVAQAVANSIQEKHELSTWIDHVRLDQ